MSGHSHWSTIKRAKGAADAKKSKIFSKMSRLITVAAKEGGGDPDANASLRLVIDKAKSVNMPKDSIQKAIDKGTGTGGGSSYAEVIYEGYGPAGVAFLVKALTDNKNRTVAEVRNIFSKSGGSLGEAGSTSYIFGTNPQEPSFFVDVDAGTVSTVENLVELLEDNDDVQEVFSNHRGSV